MLLFGIVVEVIYFILCVFCLFVPFRIIRDGFLEVFVRDLFDIDSAVLDKILICVRESDSIGFRHILRIRLLLDADFFIDLFDLIT